MSDAKRYFSRPNGPAYSLGKDYVNLKFKRQEYLETAIKWICGKKTDEAICEYMAKHQQDPSARDLWLHFLAVINWVQATFHNYRPQMKGVDWGSLYRDHKDDRLDPVALEAETTRLVKSVEVQSKSGIYAYLLTGEEKHLNLRRFTKDQKQTMFEEQGGICILCRKTFEISQMEADHITPWSEGGKTEAENGQMLCKECNRRKASR